MTIYADRPLRFLLQLCADTATAAWIAAWVWAGLALHDTLSALAVPGELMESAGEGFAENMADAAERVREVPLAGDNLAAPFTSVGEAGGSLSEAGRGFQETMGLVALVLPLLTAAMPVLFALLLWAMTRARWIRRASGAAALRSLPDEAGASLLALRAMASARPRLLTAVHPDPVGAWRAGDRAAIAKLADLELKRVGLRARRR
ncbi:hypothetical protein ACFPZ0_06460 [Streptomonospora nanhaiensis]|uniref:hypothetical protein n=1 Tax=Streptomonospora nanhaiensis TaxID=1323731 RepID=UPI001C99E050|nr:hypothetical protein [Streptomonospora nanhaiensis]MBX9390947.1 hypothetical protein [Streptomonospora nanhaiensis]